MKINYHNKSFNLLKIDNRFPTQSIENLERDTPIEKMLPESVKEWIKLHKVFKWKWEDESSNEHELLEFYSNNDRFWCTKISAEERIFDKFTGKHLIKFGQENQGNFLLSFEVNNDNTDPPVYISDFSNNWHLFFKTFSDFVYCQIFDWQFRLAFLPKWEAEIDYYETLNLNSNMDLSKLTNKLSKSISNKYTWENDSIDIKRYYKSETERIIIFQINDEYSMEIFGVDAKTTKDFFIEIKEELGMI